MCSLYRASRSKKQGAGRLERVERASSPMKFPIQMLNSDRADEVITMDCKKRTMSYNGYLIELDREEVS
jgi:hypothetical protein